MKSIPIVLAGLAALAAARPPTSEELCVGFNGDIDACQRESKVCFDEIRATKEVFTWTKLFECTQARIPSASSSAAPAAAAPTTTPKDKPAPPQNGIADVDGKHAPTIPPTSKECERPLVS